MANEKGYERTSKDQGEFVADAYNILFNENSSLLQDMVSDTGQMSLESRDENRVVYELSNSAGTISYPVVFARDENGNWKIIAF